LLHSSGWFQQVFSSISFIFLLLVACFTVVFVVDNDCQKRNLIGTDRNAEKGTHSAVTVTPSVASNPSFISETLDAFKAQSKNKRNKSTENHNNNN
jgi:hypothetical protein